MGAVGVPFRPPLGRPTLTPLMSLMEWRETKVKMNQLLAGFVLVLLSLDCFRRTRTALLRRPQGK